LAFCKRRERENYLSEELKVSRGIKDRGEVIKKKIKYVVEKENNRL
jgi:hypothetical protein